MINVQPFIDKLDRLREYMELRIDVDTYFWTWMDLQVCPTEYYVKNDYPIPKPYRKQIHFKYELSFEEWLEHNPKEQTQNQ